MHLVVVVCPALKMIPVIMIAMIIETSCQDMFSSIVILDTNPD